MKKLLIVSLVFSLVLMFSAVALATPEAGEDDPHWKVDEGIFDGWEHSMFNQYTESDRWVEHEWVGNPDFEDTGGIVVDGVTTEGTPSKPGDQKATIRVPARAVLPCYIELELIGNAGRTKVKSIGAGADADVRHGSDSIIMLFDYAITGFINKDWEFIDTREDERAFSTIAPNRGDRDSVYLHACDLYWAKVYSNLTYQFKVSADYLANGSGEELPIEMRYTVVGEADWDGDYNISDNDKYILTNAQATEENEVVMQFRVPYNNVPAATYTGNVTFMAYNQ